MNVEEYIASGILELYVAGALSEKENDEVFSNIQQYSEIAGEMEKIEAAILKIASAMAPTPPIAFSKILEKLNFSSGKEIKLADSSSRFRWIGWAAALVIVFGGLMWTVLENRELKTELDAMHSKQETLKQELLAFKDSLASTEDLLANITAKDITVIPLQGQAAFEQSYAKVYWNKKENLIYVDTKGLPEPAPGKVYQVWSLKLDPLTPTNIGLIADEDQFFELENPNESEAFGITLEPKGGSESPSLDQLYTLGIVSSVE